MRYQTFVTHLQLVDPIAHFSAGDRHGRAKPHAKTYDAEPDTHTGCNHGLVLPLLRKTKQKMQAVCSVVSISPKAVSVAFVTLYVRSRPVRTEGTSSGQLLKLGR